MTRGIPHVTFTPLEKTVLVANFAEKGVTKLYSEAGRLPRISCVAALSSVGSRCLDFAIGRADLATGLWRLAFVRVVDLAVRRRGMRIQYDLVS
jgi:hypothetical protein